MQGLSSLQWVLVGLTAWATTIALLVVLIRRDRAKDARLLESLGLRGTWASKTFRFGGVLNGMPTTATATSVRSPRGHAHYQVTRITLQSAPSQHTLVLQNSTYDSPERIQSFGMAPVHTGHASLTAHVGSAEAARAWGTGGVAALGRLTADDAKYLWEISSAHGTVNVVLGTANIHVVPEAFRRVVELALAIARL
ncbi:MAG: hypothetical protein FJ096_20865 [Deltaproteobacteria bacterium]|nr:hypothetical protein [Deltaproteobacteria bacterium]